MATHKVTKAFDYAADGHNTRRVEVGETLENVRPDVAAGLLAEGYIANAAAAETLSKVAGETIAAADHAGNVDSDKAVHEEMESAKSRISDGKIGAPEARSIIDAHKLDPLASPAVVQAAQDEKAAHDAGDTDFDPLAAESVEAAEQKVADGSAFDHDGDGRPGGSKARKAADKK